MDHCLILLTKLKMMKRNHTGHGAGKVLSHSAGLTPAGEEKRGQDWARRALRPEAGLTKPR